VANIVRIMVAPGAATVSRTTGTGTVAVPIRQAGRFDDLAAALGARLGVPAEVDPDRPVVPGAGTIVVCRPDVLHELARSHPAALPWVVGVDVLRNRVLDQVELHSLAAGVSSLDYSAWVYGDGKDPAIYGRRDVAAAIGATLSTDPLEVGVRYGRITTTGDLPELLGSYLGALMAG
jgi:hypothetical protein